MEPIEKEEEQVEQKAFKDMSDDERLALSDEDLTKGLEELEKEEPPAKPDTPAEKIPGEGTDTSADEKTDEEKQAEEDAAKEKAEDEKAVEGLDEKARGFYFDKKKAVKRAQAAEERDRDRELDLVRAKTTSEVQLKYIDKLKEGGGQKEQEAPKSHYDEAMAGIDAKAIAHEKEYGEEYRLSISDTRSLDKARQQDWQEYQTKLAKDGAADALEGEKAHVEKATREGIETLTKGGVEDWAYVDKNFIQPLVNPNLNPNTAEAIAHAMTLINIAKNGGNPAEYAYKHLAHLSDKGRKYFEGKATKKVEKDLLKNDKQVPITSAQVTGTRSTDGKTGVTQEMLNGNFEYWHSKLPEDKFLELVGGASEKVYI